MVKNVINTERNVLHTLYGEPNFWQENNYLLQWNIPDGGIFYIYYFYSIFLNTYSNKMVYV